ncbi:MAG: mevalonate kinase [Anaerolineae bacterium]|jgi:mevalonate kinase
MVNRPASAAAPGKVILFGEHAVVYGQPAIAAPVHQVRATASVEPGAPGSGLTLAAVDLDQVVALTQAPQDDPLAAMARLTLAHLGTSPPDATLTIHSTIPIASGMGSGTAVSTAIVRALAACLGRQLATETVSALVYEVEKLHHGTPSGIDNTVVAYGMPVYFVRGGAIETFGVGAALHLLIGDTGVASSTRVAVGDVRRAWEGDRPSYERLFAQVGEVVGRARDLIEAGGEAVRLGALMDCNHELLRLMDVSSPELEQLVTAARAAGALGAKLSGAGRGGNMIALVEPGDEARVAEALHQAGAVRVIETALPAS